MSETTVAGGVDRCGSRCRFCGRGTTCRWRAGPAAGVRAASGAKRGAVNGHRGKEPTKSVVVRRRIRCFVRLDSKKSFIKLAPSRPVAVFPCARQCVRVCMAVPLKSPEPRTVIDVKVGIPREVKNNEFRVAITPAGVHELVRHGHQVVIEQHAGARLLDHGRRVHRRRCADPPHRRRGLGRRRPAAEGQGADRRGVPPPPQGPDPLHLPPPGRLPRVHGRPPGVRHHRHRLRDGRDRRTGSSRCSPRCPRSRAGSLRRSARTT